MDMTGFELYFNIITLAAGVYFLYTWWKLRKAGKLFANQLLVPKDSKPEQCLDEEGYIASVSPKLLVCGLICTLVGVICLADSQLGLSAKYFSQIPDMSYYIAQGGNLICLVTIIVYMAFWVKSRKLYWV